MRFFKQASFLLSIFGLLATTLLVSAATKPAVVPTPKIPPQVILTWSVANFYPSNFIGRALPIIGTPITVSAEMLLNGKFADISKANVVWYKSGDQIDSGVGLKQITIEADNNDLENIFVRAEVTLNDVITEQSISIPITKPVVAIEIPYPDSVVGANSDITLRAIPYFFNVSSINRFIFYWQVGDIKKNMGSENSISLKIGGPLSASQRRVLVSSYVQSKDDLTNIIKTDAFVFVK